MKKNEFLSYLNSIKELLAVDDLDLSINDLKRLLKDLPSNFYNEVLLHLSKMNRLRKDERIGLMTRTELNQEEIRIRFALMELIDEISIKIRDGRLSPQWQNFILKEQNQKCINVDNIATLRVLFLGANPVDTVRLRVDEEMRKIDEGLQVAKFRERFELIGKWAVRMETLMKAMLDYNPQIVHFAGHGKQEGIILEKGDGTANIIPLLALKNLFNLFKDKVQCVLLNACYSGGSVTFLI